jgi:Fe2+ transport system protein B
MTGHHVARELFSVLVLGQIYFALTFGLSCDIPAIIAASSLNRQHYKLLAPILSRGISSCTPSALEDLIDMLTAVLMGRLEILELLSQILDISF